MGKKRAVKKRIAKKKVVRKDIKRVDNEKKDISKMSRLEYEQSMMDPRFRAAMMGFNNPMPGMNQQMNNTLREQENKNNELTRQISLQTDLANAKQKKLELQNELNTIKLQNKDEMSKLQAELENQKKAREIESLKAEHAKKLKEQEHNTEIENLKAANRSLNQNLSNEHARRKQNEEKMKLEYDLQMKQLKEQHANDMAPIQQAINELARKKDLQDLQFNQAEQIADATLKKTQAEIQKQFQDTIQPLQQFTQQIKGEFDLAKQLHEQDMELMNANHDKLKSELILEFQKNQAPLKEQTLAIKNLSDIVQTKSELTQKSLDAQKEYIKSKLNKQYSGYTQKLLDQTAELKRQDEILKAQSQVINDFKNAQAKYNEESIKAYYEPMTNQMKSQAEDIQRLNQQQQLINEEQKKVKTAEFQLTEAQIKAINEPQIRMLEDQRQRLENIMKINGDINGIYQKMEDLKTNIELLKQKATPEQIQEHGEEVRQVALAMAPLQVSKRLAERTNTANLEYEKAFSDVVALGAQALGDEFDVNEINTPKLNEKLKLKLDETQKKRAKIAAQREEVERQIKMYEGLENDKVEHAKAQAKLDVIKDHSSDYNKSIYEVGKLRAKYEEESQVLHGLQEQVQQFKQNSNEMYGDTVAQFETILRDDSTGYVRRMAQKITGQENPDPHCLPDLINALRKDRDKNLRIASEAVDENLIQDIPNNDGDKDYNQDAKVSKFMSALTRFDEAAEELGYNPKQRREELSHHLEMLNADSKQRAIEVEELQARNNQLQRFAQSVHFHSTAPLRRPHPDEDQNFNYWEGEVDGPNLGLQNSNETFARVIPTGRDGKLVMTQDNFDRILEESGFTNNAEFRRFIDMPDKVDLDEIQNISASSSAFSSAQQSPTKA